MSDNLTSLQLWLLSPLALIGAGLLLAQAFGLALQSRGLPKLYGAVAAGLLLGVSGLNLVDAPLVAHFQELFNAASALVLFEVGRKMDLAWLWRSKREGAALAGSCLLRGVAAFVCLMLVGLNAGESFFISAILVAVNPVVYSSMTSETNASGVATFAGGNMVGLSNLLALLALSVALAWTSSSAEQFTAAGFGGELLYQGGKLVLGAAIAVLCFGIYRLATRLTRAQAAMRPGMLLAVLLMDLGLCSVSSASALLSLLLMGLFLRNAENRDNVFQAQIKTGQDIGYALLFMMSASLVELEHLLAPATLAIAVLIFVVRIGATRLALMSSKAWGTTKQHALALSMCSMASFGSLVVDNSLASLPGVSARGAAIMAALLALNVLVAPALTWWGLRIAGETNEGEKNA
ncbi:cation:proton antiporter [Massilia sp. PAMC28688]|uniref:cation:proton antiporter domain-containing protein n=1 Tax=Massilia sp. PAMC28688 TaxID=2861283 RepID=UPI001C628F85|nr:cation:proton antiporter [Massilia sp. PAMC28688]QYF93674.1 cation:proton antiporter [Massilia sp. PAMC28688]